VAAAPHFSWTAYCAVLPTGWSIATNGANAAWDTHGNGWLTVTYKGPSSQTITISEGDFCLTSAAACSPNTSDVGAASIGDLSGEMYVNVGAYVIYVDPGTKQAYQLTASAGMTESLVRSLAAGFIHVPTP
jgi:hypothetical protein